jgi:C4-dicarboxylate-specific signal transduction histidine kinase
LDPVSFDESIQAYALQIALPIYDGGTAIGVIVVTLNLERLEEEQ